MRRPALQLLAAILIALFAMSSHLAAKTQPEAEGHRQSPFSAAIKATDVTSRLVGQTISLQGSVQEVIPSSSATAPVRLVLLKRGEASLEIVFWPELSHELIRVGRYPSVGTLVSARGKLERFEGNLQIKVDSPSEIFVEPSEGSSQMVASARAARTTEPINRSQPVYLTVSNLEQIRRKKGELASIRGVVHEYRASWSERAPNILYLRNDSGQTLEVVYWTDADSPKIPDFSEPGTMVHATGLVQDYQGRLQLRVDDLKNLSNTGLPSDRLAGNYEEAHGEKGDGTATGNRNVITWKPYSPLVAQRKLSEGEDILIYVRSANVPLCAEIEMGYLLHPEAADLLGARTIYFINAHEQAGQGFARRLDIFRIPTLRLIRSEFPDRSFTFTQSTKPADVAEFFRNLPRP